MEQYNQSPSSSTSGKQAASEEAGIAEIFNYPALGELFDGNDLNKVDTFCERLRGIHDELERIIRRGTKEEADSAMRSLKGIEVSLKFIDELRQKILTK